MKTGFLKAYFNTDIIDVDNELIGAFKETMMSIHEYFVQNNLYDVFDVDSFLDDYLYINKNFKSNGIENKKLRIQLSSNDAVGKVETQMRGYYVKEDNLISLLNYKNATTEEDKTTYYKNSLVHEFLHFLTLSGIAKDKNGKVYKDSYNFNYFAINEAMTQHITNKILKVKISKSYDILVRSLKIFEDFFGFNADKSFFQRGFNDYYKMFTSALFDNYIENIDNISKAGSKKMANLSLAYTSLMNIVLKENIDVMDNELILNALLKALKLKDDLLDITSKQDLLLNNKHNKMNEILDVFYNTVKLNLMVQMHNMSYDSYIKYLQKFYDVLPYKSLNDYSKIIYELNELYIEQHLTKQNIPLRKRYVKELADEINKIVVDKYINKLCSHLKINVFANVNYQNSKLVFGVRDNDLIIFNRDVLEIDGKVHVVSIDNKEINHDIVEQYIENYADVLVYVNKLKNGSIHIYNIDKNDYLNNYDKSMFDYVKERNLPFLEVSYNQYSIKIKDGNKTQAFKKKNINIIENISVEKMFDSHFEKFKKLESLQGLVKTRSLVVAKKQA